MIEPIYDTHNNFEQGGRKIHLYDDSRDKCLCGYIPSWSNNIDYQRNFKTLSAFVHQPDPDGNICKNCIKIYDKRKES